MFENKIVLITGGTGSWGQCLTKYLLEEGVKEIRIYSRNELSQVMMNRKFNETRILFFIGDVRDKERLVDVSKDVDYIFHLAALKHVDICEKHPMEAILTNIIGTKNVIHAAIKNEVKKVIYVSTDKAVSPNNLYGLTKAVGEKLMIEANLETDDTQYVCIRAGNVMGSNGSVIPLFIKQILEDNKVNITDELMTRFFITLDEAIELLIKAAKETIGGEILVMKMSAFKIVDLAKVLVESYGDENTLTTFSNNRLSEKIVEELISNVEAKHTYELDEHYFLIIPELVQNRVLDHYLKENTLKKVDFNSYNSSTDLLTYNQIKERLIKANLL